MSLKAKIEAVLFLTAKPIKAQAMARIVNADVQAVRQALLELVHDYEERQGGLEIADEDGYSFQVKDAYANLMDEFLPVEMTAALIRTLSAIAIKQPIAQSEIIRVRGAGAYEHIKELVNRELVAKKDEQGGRSPTLSTTKKFQEYFRLTKDGKDLRNYLKRQVRKANAAEAAQAEGQLVIPEVVSNAEADNELNNRIFLETAAFADGADNSDFEPPVGEPTVVGEEVAAAAGTAETSHEQQLPPPPQVDENAIAAAPVEVAPVIDASPAPVVDASAAPAAETASKQTEEVSTKASQPDAPAEPKVNAASTLSKLAAAATTTPPEPVPAVEPLEQPQVVEADEAATAGSGKGSVQAHTVKDGPQMASTPKKKRASDLTDLLKKQKDLEKALKQAKAETVEQTSIEFLPPVNEQRPDKSRPS